MSQAYYTGPAKTFINSVGLQANGAQGQVKFAITEKTTEAGTSQFGRVGETLDDATGEIDLTPFDNWNLLPTLFPTFLGVTTGVGTGFGLSNRFTLSAFLGEPLETAAALAHWESFLIDAVMRTVAKVN